MPNTKALALVLWIAGGAAGAQGFAVERLYQSAPGGGWLVMDDLDLQGGLGGAVSLTIGYARRPLQVRSLEVVQSQAFANIGLAVTYSRFRLYTNLSSPLYVAGQSGMQFLAPTVNIEQNPDTFSDVALGLDARLLGEPASVFRLGAGAQLIFPSGTRADYSTDDTYRAMGRLLVAGDLDRFSYAGHLGVHVRPLDDAATPGSPRGSELLFGAAAGWRAATSVVIGPEIHGATAFRSFLSSDATALEGLLTARYESTVRFKAGIGAGLNPKFGAPQWRVVLGVELRGR